jgi:hypothetical protein
MAEDEGLRSSCPTAGGSSAGPAWPNPVYETSGPHGVAARGWRCET